VLLLINNIFDRYSMNPAERKCPVDGGILDNLVEG